MASSRSMIKPCVTCMQNSDEQKTKPGITLCEGCQQSFCLSHFNVHRQALNTTLDSIYEQRNVLRSRIEELPEKISKEHFKVINDWESATLQTVTAAATHARQQVYQLIISEMERECSELTNKITSFRQNDDYFETDLSELQLKIEMLNEELTDLSGLHRIQLNLPTLDCSNIIQTKPSDTHLLSEITENNDSIMSESTEEYHSFIECFLTTHQPSTDSKAAISGYLCASPTMLIGVSDGQIERFVFCRASESTFTWEGNSALDVQWSNQFQHFIILSINKIVAVDALDKKSTQVVPNTSEGWQYMTHWKHLCLMADSQRRVFLYEMNKNLSNWFLLDCRSPPTTCASDENIAAIGLNESHIVLSIRRNNKYRLALYDHDMTHVANVQLTQPCMSIQALPRDEWLLYNSTQELYYVIDSELQQREEPYLSSLKGTKCVVTCDVTGKVLIVLLPRKTEVRSFMYPATEKNIKIYMNDY